MKNMTRNLWVTLLAALMMCTLLLPCALAEDIIAEPVDSVMLEQYDEGLLEQDEATESNEDNPDYAYDGDMVEYVPEEIPMSSLSDFSVSYDGKTLTKYTGTDVDVVIPEGYGIEKISLSAFSGRNDIKSIVVPYGVIDISCAFWGLRGLQSVTLPEGLPAIGSSAFSGCTSLTKVNIPNSVTNIGDSAFSSCPKLTSIEMPDSVTVIGNSVFSGCISLEEIALPGSIDIISPSTFSGCTGLVNAIIGEGTTVIGKSVFSSCSSLEEVTLPSTLIEIQNFAFYDCDRLELVNLPESLTTIGESAFRGCDRLIGIGIWENVTKIGEYVFNGCPKDLTIVTTCGSYVQDWAWDEEKEDYIYNMEVLDHTPVIEPAVAPTCTEPGLTEGSYCSVCYDIIEHQEYIPATGHNPVGDQGYPATCVANGLTDGSHCGTCGAVLVAQQPIPATGEHIPVGDPGYPATCVANGLTDGSHCATCGEVLVAQQAIPATGHAPVADPGYPATCEANGLTDGSHCAVCGAVLVAQQPIPATGHTPVIDPGVAPAYGVEGRTEGSHCAVCGAVLVAQQPIAALTYQELALSKIKSNGTVTLAVSEQRLIVPAFATASGWTVSGYKSSKPAVASIDGNGLLTANAEGKAKITVTTAQKKKATLTVKVVDPYKPTAISIAQGKAVTITMGQPLQLNTALAPESARATLTWTSSKAKVATVDGNGLVTPHGEGKAKITVRTQNKKKAKITVKVVDPNKPLGIAIAQGKAVTMKVGETLQLGVGLSPATAQSALTWKTNKAKIATVDANGVVTAVKKGKAKITVTTYNKKKATITVNVVP